MSAIICEALTKSYGKTNAISNVDLTVESGEIMGFLGTNGAGKTTTLRCLVGLLKPTSGKATVLGLDPIAEHKALVRKLGYLPGELRLYLDLTGCQHLELLANLQGVPVTRQKELCERFGLSERDLRRPIRDYSRGMKQKIGLVQAFQHDPQLVVLDEPTEGLDPLVQEAFFELLAETNEQGRTVFLSSHVLSEVQRTCSRVAVIKAGKLVTVSSVEELRGAQSRIIRLKFGSSDVQVPVESSWQPKWNNNELKISLEAERVVPVLRDLIALDVKDVVVEEADLDEAVLALYRTDSE